MYFVLRREDIKDIHHVHNMILGVIQHGRREKSEVHYLKPGLGRKPPISTKTLLLG